MNDRIKNILTNLWGLDEERRVLETQFDLLEDAIAEQKKLLEAELNNEHPIRVVFEGNVLEIDTEYSDPNWSPLTDLSRVKRPEAP